MKAALYFRVSTARQADKWSLPAQRKVLTAYAKKRGWEPVVYDEGGVSAETIRDRPQMRRLLADVAARQVDVILVVEMERLCRATDLADYARISSTCRRAGVLIATPEREFDLSRAEDDFESDLRGILSKREKRKLLERTARGRREARDSGQWFGPPPFGYRYDRNSKSLEVVEADADLVRRVFQDPRGAYQLVNALAREGTRLDLSRIGKIRRNLHYAGYRVGSDGGIIRGNWPALVTLEEYERAREGADRRRWNRGGRIRPLVGLFRCGDCGRSLMGIRTGRDYSYACSQRTTGGCLPTKSIRAWLLEMIVEDAGARLLDDPGQVEEWYRNARDRLPTGSVGDDRAIVEGQLREIEARRARLVEALEAGTLTHQDVAGRIARLKREGARLRGDLAASDPIDLPPLSAVLTALRAWSTVDWDARRTFLDAFTEEATIDWRRRVVRLVLSIGPPASYRLPSLRSIQARGARSGMDRDRLRETVRGMLPGLRIKGTG